MAALINIKPASVSAWERGKANPRPAHLKKLAGILHCSADELLPCSLARYESGECGVSGDLAYRMVQLYNSQFLAVEHLRNESRLAASIVRACTEVRIAAKGH
ncbi:helix-turn-helix domain-containing protein [Oscillibacter sp. GMB15532]|uniref:helix-turn-helix domain-containing protein n=1 Tax=Oscillibacter sp. GMB15532 TaxID=3230022 RepID=UPI0034DFDD40